MTVNNYKRDYENKKGHNLTVWKAARVAGVLGVPVEELFKKPISRGWPKAGRPKVRHPTVKTKKSAPPRKGAAARDVDPAT